MPAALTPPPAFVPLKGTKLFTPLQLGTCALSHRVVQAPLTRMRAEKDSNGANVPVDRAVQYYSQRATKGGLQISEATDISATASAYPGTPGVYSPAQLAGWKKVTDAVHAKGGFIYAQLWHTGRATGPGMLGQDSLSSTNKPMSGKYLNGEDCAEHPPRPMTVEEIHETTAEWAAASKRAVEEAGFDGVEIHGANGYLLEQFLHDNINDRTDEYGGSVENRCRFVMEVIKAVTAAIGADRTGIRLSPFNYFQDTKDSDPNTHWEYLCQQIATLPSSEKPTYVHMIEPRFDEVLDEEQKLAALSEYTTSEKASPKKVNSLAPFRHILQPAGIYFLAAGSFTRDNAVPKLDEDLADAIVFGRSFIANPDLVERLKNGWPLNQYDRTTFYGASPPEKGYLDYPFFEEKPAAESS
ncbi:NADH:flavin oxidoreductase/NADH oxidase [Xylariales sp. PMI_506]|nr:NADH:flavin oxidoreductase/NADH oxidase [Xylariales sp. PMI_506]